MKLSEHFHLDEFVTSQTAARHGIDNRPPPAVLTRLRILAAHLERARVILGGKPLLISSGYRSPPLNARIGGSKTSAHLRGDAADFICPGYGGPLAVCRAIAESDLAFDQLIEEGTWVHLGFAAEGRKARRQVMTKRPGGGYVTGLAA